jgi:hypothetical protein
VTASSSASRGAVQHVPTLAHSARAREVGCADCGVAADRGRTAAHERGGVRHRPHHARARAERRLELRDRDAGRDRHPERAREIALAGERGEHRGHDLRLHREHDQVAARDQRRVVVRGGEAERLLDVLAARGIGVGETQRVGRDARRAQPARERLGHRARTEESDPYSVECHADPLGPNRAVPTRMIVAPSSIATSKSPRHAHRELTQVGMIGAQRVAQLAQR